MTIRQKTLFTIILLFTTNIYADTKSNTKNSLITELNLYFTQPLRWNKSDWMDFGIITSSIYIVSESFDDYWKDKITQESHPDYYTTIDKIGDAWGDGRLSLPFFLSIYGYGSWNKDERYINTSHDILESAIFTAMMTQLLKRTFRRDRPNAAGDEAGWLNDGVSFPSGHTSNAFAISQSFLNSLKSPSIKTRILFYSLASSTAFARTYDNAHWASDTIAGALLGIYTANFVSEMHRYQPDHYTVAPYLDTNTLGVNIRW